MHAQMKRARVLARTIRFRLRGGRPVVHMLHIGKTGGTALSAAFRTLAADPDCPVGFLPHSHRVTLGDLPPDARYFFVVRDPIARFRSGFYSRKRQGQPRHFVPWSPGEAAAFGRFAEANDLAEALADPADAAARAAMGAIEHVRAPHLAWFGGDPALPLVRRHPVAILRQEHLQADFAAMLARLGVPDPDRRGALPTDSVASHRNDYGAVPTLSETARQALSNWYARDIDFVAAASRAAADMALERTPRCSTRPLKPTSAASSAKSGRRRTAPKRLN